MNSAEWAGAAAEEAAGGAAHSYSRQPVRRARVLKREEARGNVAEMAELPNRKDRAAGAAARDQAEVPAEVRAKAAVLGKVAASSINQLTNQPFNQLTT